MGVGFELPLPRLILAGLVGALALVPGWGAVVPARATGALHLVARAYVDLDGDRDLFPDAGETGTVSLVLRHDGPALAGVTATLTSADADVACIVGPGVAVATIPSGATITLGSLAPESWAGLRFRASDALRSASARDPARVDLCLLVRAEEPAGFEESVCFSFPAGLDVPGGRQAFIPGADGLAGTADDGILVEDFDADRDGDGILSLSDRGGVANDTIGVWVGNDPAGVDPISAVGCAGFRVPPDDPECRIEPDFDMDWHLHCPPGGDGCAARRADHRTPPYGGGLAYDGIASLHWGFHPQDADSEARVSSTRFRQIPAFMTRPINLGFVPPEGSLELSFFHIASMVDNSEFGLPPRQAVDYGDVHVQSDGDDDPNVDSWGFWGKLAPFENVYDHTPYIWSAFGASFNYCNFNPADGGPDDAAPRGVRELTCFPGGVWSHCGTAHAHRTGTTFGCPGPAFPGTVGTGLWVESRFSLEPYVGQRVRVRWIAESWEFDCCSSSYDELGAAWHTIGDDGWWIDRIALNGVLEAPASATVDTAPPPPATCPSGAQAIVDIVAETPDAPSRGAAAVRWRTTAEVDLRGFNVVAIDNHGGRVRQNDVLIPCEACVTGTSVPYSFLVPKHRNVRDLFVELVRRDGTVERYGPALRASAGH